MLDIKFILENTKAIKESAFNRNMTVDVDGLVMAYENFRKAQQEIEELRAKSNDIATQMKSATNETRPALIQQGKDIKLEIAQKTDYLREAEKVYHSFMLQIPNMHAKDIPIGKTDKDNTEITRFGEIPDFSFPPKDHLELARDLDLLDFESGADVTGSKFYFLRNEAVILEMALTRFAFDRAIKNGYTPLITPDMARLDVLEGIGFNPRGEESQIYTIDGTDLGLIATAEITVGGMMRNKILEESDLPLKFVALSHCFRREAGSAGQESKGLYRVHQFSKVELFEFVHPSQSYESHEAIREFEENLYKDLGFCFRTVDICTGDLGASAYKKYDLEAWMPGKGKDGEFGEITSTSNCTDFQARRLKIRYKDNQTGKNEFVHTLNGTALALSRVPVAILENFQQKDGSVLIPKALQPYTEFDRILPKIKKKAAS